MTVRHDDGFKQAIIKFQNQCTISVTDIGGNLIQFYATHPVHGSPNISKSIDLTANKDQVREFLKLLNEICKT
jgi:hypothetical protein